MYRLHIDEGTTHIPISRSTHYPKDSCSCLSSINEPLGPSGPLCLRDYASSGGGSHLPTPWFLALFGLLHGCSHNCILPAALGLLTTKLLCPHKCPLFSFLCCRGIDSWPRLWSCFHFRVSLILQQSNARDLNSLRSMGSVLPEPLHFLLPATCSEHRSSHG